MSDAALRTLATAAGVAPRWQDVYRNWHDVAPPTLRLVLHALGLPAATDSDIAASLHLARDPHGLLPLTTAAQFTPTPLPIPDGPVHIELEDGGTISTRVEDGMLPGVEPPGYHTLTAGSQQTVLAVAPARCWAVSDTVRGRAWVLAVQLYSLRRAGDGGLGDFGALEDFVRAAAPHGAAGVAISPVHAQFSADPDRFSPYSPSSRLMLNVLHARLDVPDTAREAEPLVDWPVAGRARLAALRARYQTADPGERARLTRFRADRGAVLETHARFEALHAHFFGADPTLWHWRRWPAAYRTPSSPAVQAFAEQHADEVALHAYMQMLADEGLHAAQAAAVDAGMPVGLIADLAVGADSGGSQCWSLQEQTLLGLSVGAPPDLLSPRGQSWGLAAFSPRGLALNGYGAFLEMLRSAMRHAGGVRIDHAMGLARLWVVPDGASAAKGAYMHFPLHDMLRLVAIESHKRRAVVLGEDLGTIPEGFSEALASASILGMRVLWFEREGGFGAYTQPRTWTPGAAAMTGTHDLPTVAGWWAGRDLEWRHKLGLFMDATHDANENAARHADRAGLWNAMLDSGAAHGEPPPPNAPAAVVDAAIRHVGTAPAALIVLPVEDALGALDQPNLPGTLDTHPNWRRRHAGPAAQLLDDPAVAARLASLGPAVA